MENKKPVFEVILKNQECTPKKGTAGASGYDVFANITEPVILRKGESAKIIPLGFACHIHDPNITALLIPRSGLGHKQGLVFGNTVGVIDSDFQNEWGASAFNRGQQDEIIINPLDRIGQIVFVPVIHPEFNIVKEFTESSDRGQGGWGSTGVEKLAQVAT